MASEFRTLLQQLADCYSKVMNGRRSLEHFVLEYGQEYTARPLPPGVRILQPKSCFLNAAIVAMQRHWIYVEGYATLPTLPIPIHHAWVAQPGSREAIDVTTTNLTDYFGVPFTEAYLRKRYRRSKYSMSLIDDWEKRWPLMQPDSPLIHQAVALIELEGAASR
jgi:hypothetical protein